ncbi:polysaccharide deacetylase family protein [Peribacillus kribbensis]|uniref:polysaccharide deacetylase family protein n=1 Tax=Peribacillus kribbensis TaxID=356658 RepID=UPI0004218C65|nr:polysaccharide deacetylase family protein [Peribacillus kribbensis]
MIIIKRAFGFLFAVLLLVVSGTGISASAKYKENIEIPVMLYHVVKPETDPANPYQYNLSEFKKEMAYLHQQGYRTLTMKQYFNILDHKASMPKKPILLTFDDNSSDFYQYILPVLKEYGMKATEFTVSSWINGSWNMTASQMLEIMDNGINIQNHSVTHSFMADLSKEQQYAEVNNAAAALRDLTGQKPQAFAYPYGNYNTDTIAVLKESGIKGAFKVGGGISNDASSRYELPRIIMLQEHTLTDFIRMVNTGY